MKKPIGYNVEEVNLKTLSHEKLCEVVGRLLQELNVTVWTDTTPDYQEIILQTPELDKLRSRLEALEEKIKSIDNRT